MPESVLLMVHVHNPDPHVLFVDGRWSQEMMAVVGREWNRWPRAQWLHDHRGVIVWTGHPEKESYLDFSTGEARPATGRELMYLGKGMNPWTTAGPSQYDEHNVPPYFQMNESLSRKERLTFFGAPVACSPATTSKESTGATQGTQNGLRTGTTSSTSDAPSARSSGQSRRTRVEGTTSMGTWCTSEELREAVESLMVRWDLVHLKALWLKVVR